MAKTKTGKEIASYMDELINSYDGAGLVVTDDLDFSECGEFLTLQRIVMEGKTVVNDEQKKALSHLVNYSISDEENHYMESLAEEEYETFEKLSTAERIKYMKDNKDTHHVYYSLLVLQELL